MNIVQLPKSSVTISYIDTVQGSDTLLFIHGLASSLLCWDYNIEYLKKHYRCIAIDLPGNGLSSKGDYPYTMQWFAAVVKEFIDTLGLTQVNMIGHSMGGYISTLVAELHPHLCNKLVLVAPAGLESYSVVERTMSDALFGFGKHFISIHSELLRNYKDSFFTLDPHDKALIDQLMQMANNANPVYLKSYILKAIQSLMQSSTIAYLKKVQDNTLIIFGKEDKMIPTRKFVNSSITSLLKDTKNKLPQASIEIIPQGGHFVQWEQHQACNVLMLAFLKK